MRGWESRHRTVARGQGSQQNFWQAQDQEEKIRDVRGLKWHSQVSPEVIYRIRKLNGAEGHKTKQNKNGAERLYKAESFLQS